MAQSARFNVAVRHLLANQPQVVQVFFEQGLVLQAAGWRSNGLVELETLLLVLEQFGYVSYGFAVVIDVGANPIEDLEALHDIEQVAQQPPVACRSEVELVEEMASLSRSQSAGAAPVGFAKKKNVREAGRQAHVI